MTKIISAFLLSPALFANELTAEAVMARVAENQELSLAARSKWIYQQGVLTRLNRSNGKMAREEYKEYSVLPTEEGTEKKLVKFEGKYEHKGRVVAYDKPGHEHKGVDIDGELVNELADELVGDKGSKDGLSKGLFPLTRGEQTKYDFKLHGLEKYRDREVYKVTFTPKKAGFEEHDTMWSGEALIDPQEFQPVLVTTHMAKRIPLAIQTLLGTNVKHVGFKVMYKKLEDGVWFPVSYGGEFDLRVVFFYARRIAISMNNSQFQKAGAESRVIYAADSELR